MVLEDKEKEIRDTKDLLRQAKEATIHEYRDFDALLAELGSSYVDGFDDALHQVKKSYPDLEVSHVSIDIQAQTCVQPILSQSTDKIFADDDLRGDGESAPIEDQIKHVEDGACQPDDIVIEEKIESTPPQQQVYLFI